MSMQTAIQVRRCRYCGCTDDNACRLGSGETCAWTTSLCDVCSRVSCQIAYARDARRDRRELELNRIKASKAPTPGQIRAWRRRSRKHKRRKTA
ncbi:MAG TPA: hypothetical protein VFW25_12485 [Silvibacterium sp.]|nr:hypothetical protein [Silvibacterium sp.]